jgi:hypothetical protein
MTQRPVGRKSRRAEDGFFPRFDRAGFEPRRGRANSQRFEAAETRDTLGDASRTHGSNPARLKHGGSSRCSSRDQPPLRFGAALFCVVSRLEVGRDVGLAKSGFRPTSAGLSPVRRHAHAPDLSFVICHLSFMVYGATNDHR